MRDRGCCFLNLRLTSFALLVLAVLASTTTGNDGTDAKGRSWTPKTGKSRTFMVEMFRENEKKAEAPIQFRYSFLISNGSQQFDGVDCWKLVFFDNDRFPPEAQYRINVLVDMQRGWPRKATPVKVKSDIKILKVGEARILIDGPAGVPLDILPLIPSEEFREGAAAVIFRSTRSGNDVILELTYSVDAQEKLRIRQRWMDGDDWWRYYEKYVDGKLVLRARDFHSKPLAADIFAEIKTVKKTDRPLLRDKRLAAFVKVEPRSPSVQHIFSRIKEETGIELETSPELKNHLPNLGTMEQGKKGWPAWMLMEHVGRTELENGAWAPTAKGYRLTGVSKVPPGRILVTSGDKPATGAEQPKAAPAPAIVEQPRAGWRTYGIAGIAILGTLGALLLLIRRHLAIRRKAQVRPRPNDKRIG